MTAEPCEYTKKLYILNGELYGMWIYISIKLLKKYKKLSFQ